MRLHRSEEWGYRFAGFVHNKVEEREAFLYHYDPVAALDELKEEAMLPNPVLVRDMIIRSRLSPGEALQLNRQFQRYLQAFGDAQSIARSLLEALAGAAPKS